MEVLRLDCLMELLPRVAAVGAGGDDDTKTAAHKIPP